MQKGNRFIISISVIMLACVLVFAGNEIRSRAEETVQAINVSARTEVTGKFSALLHLVEGMSELADVRDTTRPLPERAAHLRGFQEAYNLLMVAVMDAEGNVSSSLEGGHANLSDRAYFQQVKETKQGVISEVITSRTTGEQNVVVIQPLLDEQAQFTGAVFAAVRINDLVADVDVYSQADGSYETYLIDTQQQIHTNRLSIIQGERLLEYRELNKANFFFQRETGEIVAQVSEEVISGWKIVTELNMNVYYQDVWYGLFVLLIVLLGLVIFLVQKIIYQHKQELHPLIERLHRDELTGLANRTYLEKRVNEKLKIHQPGFFICLDLDHFKAVNDTFGHGCGDQALQNTAKTLQDHFWDEAIIARLGGDEFAIYIPERRAITTLEVQIANLLADLQQTYREGDQAVHVSASIGICVIPETATTYEALYAQADEALYAAKHHGRNCAVCLPDQQVITAQKA